MNCDRLLCRTHVLVVDDDQDHLKTLSELFASMGAEVHEAHSQIQAIGIYFRLYQAGLKPRCVVTDWWLGSLARQRALQAIGQEQRHGTSLMLLESVADLDPDVLVVCYTEDAEAAARLIRGNDHITEGQVDVLDRSTVRPSDVAYHIATHRRIRAQWEQYITESQTGDLQQYLTNVELRVQA